MRHGICRFRGIVVLVDVRVVGPGDLEHAGKAALDPAERVIDEHELAGDFQFDVDHRCSAGRHRCGLHVPHWSGGQRAEIVDPVEDFTDDVEGGRVVRATYTEVDTDCFAGLGLERLLFGQRKSGAVEYEI